MRSLVMYLGPFYWPVCFVTFRYRLNVLILFALERLLLTCYHSILMHVKLPGKDQAGPEANSE